MKFYRRMESLLSLVLIMSVSHVDHTKVVLLFPLFIKLLWLNGLDTLIFFQF